MRTHPVDLTSLAWGVILATITGLLAVLVFTETTPDLGLLVPAALICAGLLVLITALLRRGPQPATRELDRWSGHWCPNPPWRSRQATEGSPSS